MRKLKKEILDYYKKTSIYTNYANYKSYFKSLPDDLEELTKLINASYIHRIVLLKSYIKHDKISEEYPWSDYRCHDDILLTAPAIMAELFRLDDRGLTRGRENKNKIVITCRYASVLLASILKAKGIPARVRSGFAPYINQNLYPDHWICQYYNEKEDRWINVDTDEIEADRKNYNNVDVRTDYFCFAAEAWLNVRSGKVNVEKFIHGSWIKGLDMLARTLFFDFHSLMNDEISYLFFPTYLDTKKEFFELGVEELKELDDLATLMLDPDKNFEELRYLFENDKKFRVLNTPLLGDKDHLEI